MMILKQRNFHDEIELNSAGADEFLNKYQNSFYTNTPIEYKGFSFLIVSIIVDNDKIMVEGLQTTNDM